MTKCSPLNIEKIPQKAGQIMGRSKNQPRIDMQKKEKLVKEEKFHVISPNTCFSDLGESIVLINRIGYGF
ncbi:MAG: hypothetical protein DRI37_01360 [Chloroflexi bacterium]|nr:MAG: hypothetical protein DRI37_01360 [Chloroflexota bacterium]